MLASGFADQALQVKFSFDHSYILLQRATQ